MLKKSFFAAIIVALFATMGTLSAQVKYAIIIGGNMDPDAQYIPAAQQWNSGNGAGQYGFDEFWNDTYLMWEMLVIDKDYTDANVHVLFGDGRDFAYAGQSLRYMAVSRGYMNITDANSNYPTVASTFAEFANTITAADSLFVWIMSHGGTDANGSYFYSYDNHKIYDSELAGWLGCIAAHKKTVFLSLPNSGGFIPELEGAGNIVITAGGATEGASRADDVKHEIFCQKDSFRRISNIQYRTPNNEY